MLLAPELLAELGPLALEARNAVEGVLAGIHRSAALGSGGEFVQYRAYVPGDDLKHIDWKLLARSGRVFTRVHRTDTEMRCAVLLDSSASMGYQGSSAIATKLHYAQTLAACLAYLARRQGDKAALFVASGDQRRSCPHGTPATFPRFIEQLDGLQPTGSSDLLAAFTEAEAFLGPHRGVIIILSDFWDENPPLVPLLRQASFAKRDCLVFHVLDDDELALPSVGPRRFIDSETGEQITAAPDSIRASYRSRMSAHLDALRQSCLDNEAAYHLATTSMPYGQALTAALCSENTCSGPPTTPGALHYAPRA
ncbi:MAG: DUF58 domain-containing protein [Victivallales bacterium]|nr:DUF58 domain-containing protein [Victivallales bacterium]